MKVRVLFVDDDPLLLETVQDLLHKTYDVVTAQRGSAGLAILANEQIPIVCSDLRMPEMDGVTFLGEVRARAPTTVRLLLTGHADLDTAVRAVNHGAIYRLLLKPCPPADLHTALRDAVEQSRIVGADRELLANRVEQLSTSLVRAERLATLGTMAAAVSHEMRNALAILRSSIAEIRDLMERGAVPDAELVQLLETGEARLCRHVTGVLGMAHAVSPSCELFDVSAVARSVVELLRDVGVARRVSVGVACDERPCRVLGDRGEMEQVLINLVKNAIEAIEDGPRRTGKVTVEVRSGEHVEIVVRDDGCGIPAAKLDTIFEPFFTTKEPGRGTGLGLPVVKQIVVAHRGSIQVASDPATGTRFTIQLPAARSGRPSAAQPLVEQFA